MSTTAIDRLTDEQAWERLRTEAVGRLVTLTSGDVIDVYPINYACLTDTLAIRTHPGMKLASLAVYPDVVFEVDHHAPGDSTAWSVVVRARAHIVRGTWAATTADSIGLHPLVDVDAEDVVVLAPTSISAREFHVHTDPVPALRTAEVPGPEVGAPRR